jgi:accessory gene regulator B
MDLNLIANALALCLGKKLALDKGQIPIYAYGLELLLSGLINILLIVGLSILFHEIYAWFFFLLAFIPLRVTAGGFHAHTHFRCTAICLFAFAAAIYIAHLMPTTQHVAVNIILSLINLGTVVWLAPVQSAQKPLNSDTRHKNRKNALILATIVVILSVIGVFFRVHTAHLFFSLGVFTASISQVAGKIQNNLEGRL